jgi:hypothetical protein
MREVTADYSVEIAGAAYGFLDMHHGGFPNLSASRDYSVVLLGPFGSHEVPFSGGVGYIGLSVSLVAIFAAMFTWVARKRKAAGG